MKKLAVRLFAGLALLNASTLLADTLELADGTLLEGDFVGSSNGIVMFNAGGSIEAFPEDEVVGIFLSAGVETQQNLASNPATLTVPAGTRLVVRMSDAIDSRQHSAGHRFRGQLESAVSVDGATVLPRGTIVHGRIVSAQQAGRIAGSSQLSIEFTDVMIGDELFQIATSDVSARTEGEMGNTVRRTARGAALGQLIDGRSGRNTGARVGAGVSILTAGASINIPRGTLLDVNLRAALTVPR